MKRKFMTLAFVGALALSAIAPNAVAGANGVAANTRSASAVTSAKKVPPRSMRRTSSTAISSHTTIPPHTIDGKKK